MELVSCSFQFSFWHVPGAPLKEIYFLALIDVLTHYGVRKQAAKAAKTVKYGANVDGISTCDPEQYGKRFIEFMSKAIEWVLYGRAVTTCAYLLTGSKLRWGL